MVYTREEIIDKLREAAKKTTFKNIWLFGSVARNEHDEESDIDIIVEKSELSNFNDKMIMYDVMTELSGKEFNHILTVEQIEEIKNKSIERYTRRYEGIQNDKILIYSKDWERINIWEDHVFLN